MAYEINFCETKEQLKHLAEVASGKVDGSPSGADIDESTLTYTGQVRRTLTKLINQFDQQRAILDAEAEEAINTYRRINAGDYSSGPLLLDDKFTYAKYNGGRFYAKNPPYTTDPATYPDPNSDTVNLIELDLPDEQFVRTVANQTAEQIVGGEIFPEDYDQALLLGAQSSLVSTNATRFRVNTGSEVEILYLWEPSGTIPSPPFTITDISANTKGGYDFTTSGGDFECVIKYFLDERPKGNIVAFGAIEGGIISCNENAQFAADDLLSRGVTIPQGVFLFDGDPVFIPDGKVLVGTSGYLSEARKGENSINKLMFRLGSNCVFGNFRANGNFSNYTNQGTNDITLGSLIVPGNNNIGMKIWADDSESSHIASSSGDGTIIDGFIGGRYQDHAIYFSTNAEGIHLTDINSTSDSGRQPIKFRGKIKDCTVSKFNLVTDQFTDAFEIQSQSTDTEGSLVISNGIARAAFFALCEADTLDSRLDDIQVNGVTFYGTQSAYSNFRDILRRNNTTVIHGYKNASINGGTYTNVLVPAIACNYDLAVTTVSLAHYDVIIETTLISEEVGSTIVGNVYAPTDTNQVSFSMINCKEAENLSIERRLQGLKEADFTGSKLSGRTWAIDIRNSCGDVILNSVRSNKTLLRNIVNTASNAGTVDSLSIVGANVKASPAFRFVDGGLSTVRHYTEQGAIAQTGNTQKPIGTTAERPVFNNGIRDGFQYFDTTLGYTITRSGSGWVDGTGSPV